MCLALRAREACRRWKDAARKTCAPTLSLAYLSRHPEGQEKSLHGPASRAGECPASLGRLPLTTGSTAGREFGPSVQILRSYASPTALPAVEQCPSPHRQRSIATFRHNKTARPDRSVSIAGSGGQTSCHRAIPASD